MIRVGPGNSPSARPDPARSVAIKGWVRSALELDESVSVVVTELTCTDPGCPPLETVIAVLAPDSARKVTLHEPLADLTRAQVVAAVATMGGDHDHR